MVWVHTAFGTRWFLVLSSYCFAPICHSRVMSLLCRSRAILACFASRTTTPTVAIFREEYAGTSYRGSASTYSPVLILSNAAQRSTCHGRRHQLLRSRHPHPRIDHLYVDLVQPGFGETYVVLTDSFWVDVSVCSFLPVQPRQAGRKLSLPTVFKLGDVNQARRVRSNFSGAASWSPPSPNTRRSSAAT